MLNEELNRLKNEKAKFEKISDFKKAQGMQREIDRLNEHKREYLRQLKEEEKDPVYEKKRKSVGNALSRAMAMIKNKQAKRHFRNSISGFYGSSLSYNPDPDIEWNFK